MDDFRRAGKMDDLPRGLLTRAWLRSLTGARTGADSAQSDLDEAWEIAERGPMPLFLADIHLHRARLFGPLKPGTRGGRYPWESAVADLAAARWLIGVGIHKARSFGEVLDRAHQRITNGREGPLLLDYGQ